MVFICVGYTAVSVITIELTWINSFLKKKIDKIRTICGFASVFDAH